LFAVQIAAKKFNFRELLDSVSLYCAQFIDLAFSLSLSGLLAGSAATIENNLNSPFVASINKLRVIQFAFLTFLDVVSEYFARRWCSEALRSRKHSRLLAL
jgi:hypothetical protein